MGHLFPQFPWRPARAVNHTVDLGDVAPTARAALRAKQLLQPLIAEHKHRIGLDHQLRVLVAHAAGFQLIRAQHMQEILLAVALDPLLGVGRAKQLPFVGPRLCREGLECTKSITFNLKLSLRGVIGLVDLAPRDGIRAAEDKVASAPSPASLALLAEPVPRSQRATVREGVAAGDA